MEKLGNAFKSDKEEVIEFIERYYGISLKDTQILPMSQYPNIAAEEQKINLGKLKMAVSKLVMKVLENIKGAGLAGHNTVFYSQSLLGDSLSETNMFQICAHEFGHILTERIIGKEWMGDKLSYEELDGFADFVAYQILKEKYGEHFDWYGNKDNLAIFDKSLKEKGITDGESIISYLKNCAEK